MSHTADIYIVNPISHFVTYIATLGMGMHDPYAPVHPSSGDTSLTTQDESTMYSSPPSYQELMEKGALHNSEGISLETTRQQIVSPR